MRRATLIFALLWCAVSSFAQPTLADTTKLYFHDAKFSWRAPLSSLKTYIGAGTGTVTTFSSGNLSPLFTTSVSNATTTPALSFSLSTADENSYFGNPNGTPGAPAHTEAGSLSKTDDTNVTLTLGGSPTVSLLKNVSLTLGWTGQLSTSRGGTGLSSLGSAKSILRVNGAGTALEYSAVQSIGTSLAVGTTSDAAASAALDVVSTTKGVLLAPMTTAQRDAITSPAEHLIVSNNETHGIDMYSGTRWMRLNQSAGTPTFTIGTGWGTGATSSITGNDLAGKVTVTSGTGSLTMTNFGTITFNKAFPTGAKYVVNFQIYNDACRGANLNLALSVSETTTSFLIDINNASIISRLGTSTTYILGYSVTQIE
jgi:hypothetical protein